MHDVPHLAEPSLGELFTAAIGFIRRQFPIILAVLPLTIGLAVFYLFVTPPLYKGETKIIFDASKVQIFKQSILEDPAILAAMDSQTEILRSDNFALSIINKLGLTQDPEFVGSGLMDRIISLPFRLLRPLLHPVSSNKSMADELTQRVLNDFEKRLTVDRVGMSYVIAIGFLSTSPDRAAQIANAVADGFIVDQLQTKYQTIARATGWLQDRLNELRAQVSAADRAVIEYKTKNNIVVLDTGGHLMNEQQLSDLNIALVKARADMVEAKARLDRVTQIVDRGDVDPAGTDVATVADAMHNEIIIKLRGQYLELAQREALYSNKLGHDHLAVVNIRNQMREIRRSIFDELNRIAGAAKSDYDIAKARENSLQGSVAAAVSGSQTTNKAQIELRQLESAAQSYRALYDNFQQRYTDSVQEQSLPVAEARVITRALPPLTKTSPKGSIVLFLATMGGLFAGLGLALLREISDRVFRTSKQVEALLRTPCVAVIPMVKPGATVAPAPADGAASRIIGPSAGLLQLVIDSPLSRFVESIRAVKVSADLNGMGKSNKVIGITSSLPNEGKSTIAACLAQLSAHGGARVLLIDCDLRNPSLSRDLAPVATRGLIDVLAESASIDEVIWSDATTKLSFLPAGVRSRRLHTNEILASVAMKKLFVRLSESYDYVIVDLSPVAPVVDVRSTTHLVDCYVFVVEWGRTKIGVAEHAFNSARGVYDNLLGVVLNKVDFKRLGRYDNSREEYYYNSHYARYGYTD